MIEVGLRSLQRKRILAKIHYLKEKAKKDMEMQKKTREADLDFAKAESEDLRKQIATREEALKGLSDRAQKQLGMEEQMKRSMQSLEQEIEDHKAQLQVLERQVFDERSRADEDAAERDAAVESRKRQEARTSSIEEKLDQARSSAQEQLEARETELFQLRHEVQTAKLEQERATLVATEADSKQQEYGGWRF